MTKAPKPLKKVDENERFARLTALSLEVPFSVKADDKAVVSFADEPVPGEDETAVNQLKRSQNVRVYHSSSDEDDDDDDDLKHKNKIKRRKLPSDQGDILKKLETFDGGFWKDEEVTLDPRIKSQVKKDDSNEVSAAIEESNSKTKVVCN